MSAIVVLDSSVVIKWFKTLHEEKRKEALLLRDNLERGKIEVAVPALIYFEILNIIVFETNISKIELSQYIDTLYNLPFDTHYPNRVLSQETFSIAQELHVTAYDATYLALAKSLNSILITSDKELIKKGRGLVKPL